MKNKRIKIICITLSLTLVLSIAIFTLSNLAFFKGRCVKTEDGRALYVINNSPVLLSGISGDKFTTGDEIFIVCANVFAESYPEQGSGYMAVKLKDGNVNDLPQIVVKALEDLGYKIK